ncbi:MFS transporter [Bradyrhizobium sp. U87765 SZCCT0131]|uniref:MFS transporter n=1 Tax=unclassified Bradyrhizobium TaxID=2631580 RepID=UPI001BA81229|nr:MULTISPECIES: MFS transporter [unclassified Bradyrhizobium]MBR1221652.1 MFS transporter [Bradyrhizobium sp. U87765 SZCCT0131]MBR1264425.1 MFS transporter [Bradyrhizobium sp. U87765 SZCCT0134]MBR1304668.1 MFS transporter [Bradyrhizobium sp. U87765 SZCCT0110]MBR1322475.1 MFS transporter [Bradyrhizobium sp. U87765 SZCCT0109]MBR1346597.1 MFS transporter [Bradyrhizobium sp. U87765 SZCCT0048]
MHTRIDVGAAIDDSTTSAFQIRVFVLCFLVALCDGFDTQALAYIAPVIASDWQLPARVFGPVFAAVLLGAMIGAFAFGHLADRIGRRRVLLLCVVLFGVLSVASAFAWSIEALAVIRFLCGLGLGGAVPNIMALVSEYAPARRRRTWVAITLAGIAVGAVLAGMVCLPLITLFGWRFIFVVGGVLPLGLALVLVRALPESIGFLVAEPDGQTTIASILRQIDPRGGFKDSDTFALPAAPAHRGSFASLFRDGLAVGSVCLALAFFSSLLLVYLFTSWIPMLLHQAGLPLHDAVLGAIVFNLAGMAGGIVCTQLVDRGLAHPVVVLVVAYLLGAVAVLSIGVSGMAFGPIMAAISFSGFCVIGGQLALNAHIAGYYPVAVRGTGIGWSQVVGRMGSLLGPLVGGALVALEIPPAQLFQVSCVAPLLSCAALLAFALLSRHVRDAGPRRSLP